MALCQRSERRSQAVWPRWLLPLSTTQNTRRAEAYGSTGHHLLDEPAERLDACFRLAAAEDLGLVHVPGSEVLEGAAPVVLVLDAHVPAGDQARACGGSGAGLGGRSSRRRR